MNFTLSVSTPHSTHVALQLSAVAGHGETEDHVAMAMSAHALDAVLRFPDVKLSREAFESVLALRLDRFEPSRASTAYYGQINLPESASWEELERLVDRIGPLLQRYLHQGEIARPHVDAALYLDHDKVSTSILIPSEAIFAMGRWGFDLEVSAYLTSPD